MIEEVEEGWKWDYRALHRKKLEYKETLIILYARRKYLRGKNKWGDLSFYGPKFSGLVKFDERLIVALFESRKKLGESSAL